MSSRLRQAASAAALTFAIQLSGCVAIGPEHAPAPAAAMAIPGNSGLRIVAGHFEIAEALGQNRRGAQLVGSEFMLDGTRLAIAAVERDPDDSGGEIELYKLDRLDAGNRAGPYCPADAAGRALAFPMAGSWTASGRHLHADGQFSLICLGSPEAKCVHLGYRPWHDSVKGVSLWDYHEACVRALRADYCGSGLSHAPDPAGLSLYDTIGTRQMAASPGMSFEAAWSARGAACVRHVRAPGQISLKDLRTECANLPKSKLGDACDEQEPALLYSKSSEN